MRRPLLLNGFMGTGKTSVGQRIAESTGRPFIDLDQKLEQRFGTTVADYFAKHGEAAFRAVEREELVRLLDEACRSAAAPVIALGGGALLSRELRLAALDRAVVVTLEAEPSEILARAGDRSSRPLLAGENPAARVEGLLELRAPSYAEAHARVSTTRRSVSAIADEVVALWRRDPLAVAAGSSSYAVEVGRNIAAERLPALVGAASKTLLVTDENVAQHHSAPLFAALAAAKISADQTILPPGEDQKHIRSIEALWLSLQRIEADRKSLLVGLGGGVVTDMTGFAAATYMRGVRWIGIPTTLLALVDASTGGKTGVDLGPAKNAVGAFWQPSAVICDVALEATESDRNYRSALAEVIKTALIGDPELFYLVERESARVAARDPELVEEMVRRSVRVKARIVSADERESGLRAVLNLGHTVGHAIELEGGFARHTHGEAISLGLVAALRLGARRGVTPRDLEQRVTRLLGVLGLPVDLAGEPLGAAAALVGHDKKRAGTKLKFVFARDVGDVRTEDLDLEQLRAEIPLLA
jgi:shikimate kinase/3-dehydroquinate synthase